MSTPLDTSDADARLAAATRARVTANLAAELAQLPATERHAAFMDALRLLTPPEDWDRAYVGDDWHTYVSTEARERWGRR